MKYVKFQSESGPRWGVLQGDTVFTLGDVEQSRIDAFTEMLLT